MPLFLVLGTSRRIFRTTTENISKDGFFCYLSQPVFPGETIGFVLSLPPGSTGGPLGTELYLQGEAEAVRFTTGNATFGLGCRLKTYHLVSELPPEFRASPGASEQGRHSAPA